MTIDEVVLLLFLIFLALSMFRDSPAFLVVAAIMLLIVAAVVNENILAAEPVFVRVGTLTLEVAVAILLFVQGALNLRREFEAG